MSHTQSPHVPDRLLDPFRAVGAVVLTLAAVFVVLGVALLVRAVGVPTLPVDATGGVLATALFTALLLAVGVGLSTAAGR